MTSAPVPGSPQDGNTQQRIKLLDVCVQNAPAEEVEDHLDRLKQSVSSVEDVLHGTTTPNLKAVEKMVEVNDKFLEVTEGPSGFLLSLSLPPERRVHLGRLSPLQPSTPAPE